MNTSQTTAIIRSRCPRCQYGCFHYNDVRCSHPHHPGYVGGCGTEWAARCDKFVDTGRVGRLKEVIVRDPADQDTTHEDTQRGRHSHTIFNTVRS